MNPKPPDPETREKAFAPPIPKRRRWPLVLFGVLLLLSGMIIGVAGNEYYHKYMRDKFIGHPERASQLIARRLKSELNLSSQQEDQVEKILAKRMKDLEDIQRQIRPQMDKELDQLRDEIAQLLDETQKRRWFEHFTKARQFLPPPFLPPPAIREGDKGPPPNMRRNGEGPPPPAHKNSSI